MLAQEGALSDLVQQHLRAKGKLGALRLNKLKMPPKKTTNGSTSTNGSNGQATAATTSTTTNGTERSPKSLKRRRSGKGNGRKKARRKK